MLDSQQQKLSNVMVHMFPGRMMNDTSNQCNFYSLCMDLCIHSDITNKNLSTVAIRFGYNHSAPVFHVNLDGKIRPNNLVQINDQLQYSFDFCVNAKQLALISTHQTLLYPFHSDHLKTIHHVLGNAPIRKDDHIDIRDIKL